MAETKKKTGTSTGSANTKSQSKAAQTRAKNKAEREKHKEEILRKSRIHDEIWSIIFIAVGVFLAVSLQTEATGIVGHGIKSFLMGVFGIVAYILPYYLIVYGILLFAKQTAHIGARSAVCLTAIFLMAAVINSAFCLTGEETFGLGFIGQCFATGKTGDSAGVFGMLIGLALVKVIGKMGLWIFCSVVIVVCALLLVNTPISAFFDNWKAHRIAVRAEREEAERFRKEEEARGPQTGVQETMDLKPANPKPAAERKPILVVGVDEPELPRSNESLHREPPIHVRRPGEISEGQKQILNLMKDDTLFESRGVSEGLGLEAPTVVEAGKGLTPTGVVIEKDNVWDFDKGNTIIDPELQEAIKEAVSETTASAAPLRPVESNDPIGESRETEPEPLQREAVPSPSHRTKTSKESKEPVETMELPPQTPPVPQYQFPPMDLLNKPSKSSAGDQSDLQAKARLLEETLHNFNVNAKVVQVTRGPAVTRYEIQPNTGVKVSSIVRLSDDIALNLAAKSIRIEAPIPGKAAVGIEVENENINMVTIREIIDSKEFASAKSKIAFAVGKDIAGKRIIADLKSMPHLLIAGSTGSGKSVCINSLICSILYHATPEEVKLILVDPKVVELSNYNGIPHLLIPVVTEPKKAAAALNWAVAEMNERYKKFAAEGVRDLAGYNEAVKTKGEDDKFMPQIVIIIDELADLMIAAPSQVEESINRLAALARAAGMHLVVATQRPSVDVITGVIKANIGSRIAFAVSSQFDSRTILDMAGAEKLVGKGDMLFAPMGQKAVRVQGCFISDSEVHSIIDFLKNQSEGATEYAEDVLHSIERVQSGSSEQEEEVDELLADAIEMVVQAQQASISMLQRRFRIGYNRAARLIDMMEARRIIGPADGSRPRKVLIDMADLANMQAEAEGEDEGVPEEI